MTQQILLYNQQYVYDDGNKDSVSSVTVTYAVTISSVTVTYVVSMKTSVFDQQHSLLLLKNNDTAVTKITASYLLTLLPYGTTSDTARAIVPTIFIRPVYNLPFDTVFDGRTVDNGLDLYFDTVFDGRTDNNDNYYVVILQYQILLLSR